MEGGTESARRLLGKPSYNAYQDAIYVWFENYKWGQ